MATKKITDLVEITTAGADDVLPIVDVSLDITNKITTTNLLKSKQDLLESGTNIKTINSTSLLGSGDISIEANPSGGAGAIQFSDGSAFASDAANLFWDDANNRLGVGTNTPTATTHVKGSGTTSATTALLVQNSAGVASLQVLDDTSVFNNGAGAVASNTAFGNGALINNTTGNNNTANGIDALRFNTTGTGNTANGSNALRNNTASNNVAVGFEAAFTNTTGTGITAIGYLALRVSTGANNTAVGFRSLLLNSTGISNTANGVDALRSNTTGSNNTANGVLALLSNTTGSNNTAIGYNTQSGNFSGCTILGSEATATANNQFVVGSTGTNAGAVTTEVIVPDTTWTVRINGANYKIAMLAI
jgi:hypothetical protein